MTFLVVQDQVLVPGVWQQLSWSGGSRRSRGCWRRAVRQPSTRCHSEATVGARQLRASFPAQPAGNESSGKAPCGRETGRAPRIPLRWRWENKQPKGESGATGAALGPMWVRADSRCFGWELNLRPELANNLPTSMALCTGVPTSDLLARWARKEGGRARWKGSYSSLDGVSWEV